MKKLLVLLLCLVTVSGFCDGYGAYKDAVQIQETNPFNPNAVKSFVYHIFFLFDKHVPVEEILPNLVEKDLNMVFPEATLKSHAEFKAWYAKIGETVPSNTHSVESVGVTVVGGGTYEVHLVVFWEAVNKKGEYIKVKFDQNWVLVDVGGRLRIKEYLVKEAK